jgi:hypothetical protein
VELVVATVEVDALAEDASVERQLVVSAVGSAVATALADALVAAAAIANAFRSQMTGVTCG